MTTFDRPELQISSLVNILERDTCNLAEEWSHLKPHDQLDRLSDLSVLVKTLKQVTDKLP
mgnify:CR=1 FL=1